MTPRQLTLRVDPDPLPDRLRDPVYAGFAYGPKDGALASCKHAIRIYSDRHGPPQQLICHPGYAEAVGAECEGIPVIADGRAKFVVLLGPLGG